jgi:hypothetical protein
MGGRSAAGTTFKRKGSLRLKAGGGLKSSAAGVELDYGTGTGQPALGNHTHAQLHDALTTQDGQSIGFSLTNQLLSAELRLRSGSGMTVTPSGTGVDFGAGTNQAARGDHTHTLLHNPLTAANSNSLALTVDANQVLSGTVRRKSGGAILEDANGIYVDLGSGTSQAARGDHTHALATTLANGLLSASDKKKLDSYGEMLQVDASVAFTRHDYGKTGVYVGGMHRWGQPMQIIRWHATAAAPIGTPIWLGLELNGVVVDMLQLGAGSTGDEAFNANDLTDQHLDVDLFARILVVSGTGTGIENEASRFDVMLEVRPSLATAPTIRINAGGGAIDPFSPDQFYDSGSAGSTVAFVDTSAVVNPAPMAVYQTSRFRAGTPASAYMLNYHITGLAKGIGHTVRLHFNETFATGSGQVVIRPWVGTTPGVFGYGGTDLDIYALAGGQNKAYIKEFAGVLAGPNGDLWVTLEDVSFTHYGVRICAIEVIPSV